MRKHKKNAEYPGIFGRIALVVCGSGLALAALLYISFSGTVSGLIQSYTADQLYQIRDATDLMLENAKSTLLQYSANPDASRLLNAGSLGDLDTYLLLRNVQSASVGVPYSDKLYLYNQSMGRIYFQGKVYTTASFPDQDIVARLTDAGAVRKLYPISRSVPAYSSFQLGAGQTEEVYTFIFWESSPPAGAAVLNLSLQEIKSMIQSRNSDLGREIVITDAQGNVELGSQAYPFASNIGADPAFRSIYASGRDFGYSVQKIGGKPFLISYVSSDIFSWKYIRITPYAVISGSLLKSLLWALVIFLGVSLVALFAGSRLSKRLSGTIRRALAELEKKRRLEAGGVYAQRQKLLNEFLLCSGGDAGALSKRLAQAGIGFALDEPFRLVLLRIDRYQAYCATYAPEDRELFGYGVVNILNELSASMPRHEAADTGRGVFALIWNGASNGPLGDDEAVFRIVSEMQAGIRSYLGMTCSVAVGGVLGQFSELHDGFAEGMEAMSYRLCFGAGSVIDAAQVRLLKKKDAEPPEADVRGMLDRLFLGDEDAALADYDKILALAETCSFTSMQMSVLRILLALKGRMEERGMPSGAVNMEHYYQLMRDMPEMDSLEPLHREIGGLFGDIAARVRAFAQEQDTRLGKQLQQVRDTVGQRFHDPGFSAESLAACLNVNPGPLKRSFKADMGESLSEYINQIRLQKAKELLEGGDSPVSEIALLCGFSNVNYFYTLFKKKNGITANEYRNLNRISDGNGGDGEVPRAVE